MKKTLSLILVVVMLLGCMSVTAFAAGTGIKIGGVEITETGELDNSKFQNIIKSGTVTYTPASGEKTAKLTLDNADISAPWGSRTYSVIYSPVPLEIELLGQNTVTDYVYNETYAININGNLVFSGTGSLTIVGAAKVDTKQNYPIKASSVTIPEGYKAFGSEYNSTVTEIGKMAEVYFEKTPAYIKPQGYEQAARRIVIFNPIDSENSAGSGSTVITAKKLLRNADGDVIVPVSYEIVIPAGITLNQAGRKLVGHPTVINVNDATENTVISYTVTTTQLTLDGSDKIMTTSYYTDKTQNTPLTDDSIKVYEHKALVNNPTELYVEVTPEDWYKAEVGIYTATMTFNFTSTEGECPVTLSGTVYRVGNIYKSETVDVEIYTFDASTHVLDVENSCVTTMSKSTFDSIVGSSDYKTGDIFHNGGSGLVKCTAPDSHSGLSTLTFKEYVAD